MDPMPGVDEPVECAGRDAVAAGRATFATLCATECADSRHGVCDTRDVGSHILLSLTRLSP